jgi:ribosome-associated toxin RatA of RatAB toxin-antitoxin module
MKTGQKNRRRYLKLGAALLGLGMMVSLGSGQTWGATVDLKSRLEAGEIIVSTKEVPGQNLRTVQMTAVVNAPPKVVWQVITDINGFALFMPRTIKSMAVSPEKLPLILKAHPTEAAEVEKIIGPTPPNPLRYHVPGGKYVIYHYSNLDFPWPCHNRWYILKSVYDETQAAQQRYHSTWSLVTGNLKENRGEWTLTPWGHGQTKVSYRLATDPGGSIPEFLVKEGTSSTMPQVIAAIREQAAKLCRRAG